MTPIHVLFLCLGNICRSPLAEGVFRAEVERRGLGSRFHIDSAGTGSWHVGEPPDGRSVAVARTHGVDISGLRARQLAPMDYERFDWIVAMDGDNLRAAQTRRPEGASTRVVRFMDYVPGGHGGDVPDPYYGGPKGFQQVYDLLASGAGVLLDAMLAGEREA